MDLLARLFFFLVFKKITSGFQGLQAFVPFVHSFYHQRLATFRFPAEFSKYLKTGVL
jgi:hypothetical protein